MHPLVMLTSIFLQKEKFFLKVRKLNNYFVFLTLYYPYSKCERRGKIIREIMFSRCPLGQG